MQSATISDILKLNKPDWWLTTIGIVFMIVCGILLWSLLTLFTEATDVSSSASHIVLKSIVFL